MGSMVAEAPPAESVEQVAQRLEGEVAAVCGVLNAGYARLVELVAEAMAAAVHVDMSITQWVSWKTGLDTGTTRRVVRLAAARQTHPLIVGAFAEGRLSVDQAAIAVGCPAAVDGEFADLATVATVAQLRVLVRAAKITIDPPADRADPVERAEDLTVFLDDAGRLHVRGELDADHGRVFSDALREARDALFHAGHPDVDWVDALVEIAERSLDSVKSPARRERFRSYIFIDVNRQVAAKWIDGVLVPDWLVAQQACDGVCYPVAVEGGLPVNVGTRYDTPPERTRRIVLHRDAKCRVPWCTQHNWLQIHHLVHREHHGPTDTWNLAALCAAHHRMHHKGLLGIEGDADAPDGLTFTNRYGTTLHAAAKPLPPSGLPPPPAQPYQHPLGEPLQRRWISFENHVAAH